MFVELLLIKHEPLYFMLQVITPYTQNLSCVCHDSVDSPVSLLSGCI